MIQDISAKPSIFLERTLSTMKIYDSAGKLFLDAMIDFGVGIVDGYLHTTTYRVKIDDYSKEIIKDYEHVRQTSDNVYFAQNQNHHYILDKQGNIQVEYENATSTMINQWCQSYVLDQTTYLYNHLGSLIYSGTFINSIDSMVLEDYMLISQNSQIGVINRDGDIIIPFEYEHIDERNGLMIARKSNQTYDIYADSILLNTIEKVDINSYYGIGFDDRYVLTDADSSQVSYYKDNLKIGGPYLEGKAFNRLGYAVVTLLDGQQIIVDMDFEMIQDSYDTYRPFGNYFIVSDGVQNEYGMINHLGEMIIPIDSQITLPTLSMRYFSASSVNQETPKLYVLNSDDELIDFFTLTYEEVQSILFEPINYSLMTSFYMNYMYYLNQTFSDAVYEITDYIGDLLICEKDGKYGVINKNKEVIIPFDYDSIYGNRTN
jgi:hypothetical protein